jgi:plastocyanin
MSKTKAAAATVLGGLRLAKIGALAVSALGFGVYHAEAQSIAVVTITDEFRFRPDEVTVHAGDIVEWHNGSYFAHIITDDPKLAGDQRDASLPSGAAAFSSGEIAPGGTFRIKLAAAGTYRYFCMPHEGIGMLGKIVVLPRD